MTDVTEKRATVTNCSNSKHQTSGSTSKLDQLLIRRMQVFRNKPCQRAVTQSSTVEGEAGEEVSVLNLSVPRVCETNLDQALGPKPIGGCRLCNTDCYSERELLLHISNHVPGLLYLNKRDPIKLTGHKDSSHDRMFRCTSPAQTRVDEQFNRNDEVAVSDETVDNYLTPEDDSSNFLNYHTCPDCFSTFETASAYADHLDSHLQRSVECKIQQNLNKFVRSADLLPSTAGNVFKCSECQASFSDVNRYQEHMKAHGFLFEDINCVICGESFGTHFELNLHMGSHTGGTHDCKNCGKCYRSRKNLVYHMRTHTGDRPHVCDECGKGFMKPDALKFHAMTHYPEAKPFSCVFCGWRFAFRKDLDVHVRTHTGEKPFECVDCGKSFSQKKSLKNHRKSIHTEQLDTETFTEPGSPDTPICQECGDAFKDADSLEKHRSIHSETANDSSRADDDIKIEVDEPDEEELAPVEESGYPKYKPVVHALENDYLNGLLLGITHRIGSKRPIVRSRNRNAHKVSGETFKKKAKAEESAELPSSSNGPETESRAWTKSASPTVSAESNQVEASVARMCTSSDSSENSQLFNNVEDNTNAKKNDVVMSPFQNDYFLNLVQSNVRKYNRQRVKDPLDDYMLLKHSSISGQDNSIPLSMVSP